MVDKARLQQAAEAEKAAAEAEDAAPPIHLPGPSVWPAVLAFGVALLLFGILSSWVFSLVGLAAFVWAVASWISQIRQESAQHDLAHETPRPTEGGSPQSDAHA